MKPGIIRLTFADCPRHSPFSWFALLYRWLLHIHYLHIVSSLDNVIPNNVWSFHDCPLFPVQAIFQYHHTVPLCQETLCQCSLLGHSLSSGISFVLFILVSSPWLVLSKKQLSQPLQDIQYSTLFSFFVLFFLFCTILFLWQDDLQNLRHCDSHGVECNLMSLNQCFRLV